MVSAACANDTPKSNVAASQIKERLKFQVSNCGAGLAACARLAIALF
jgi:hypothetical protein